MKDFKTAYVYYEGRTKDGTVFDSNLGAAQPMPILVGKHEVIPGFERALAEMKVGEKRDIIVTPDQAYGYPDEKAVQRSRRSYLKNGELLEVGKRYNVKTPASETPVDGLVTRISGDFIEMDFNHPLAGKDLYFTIELVDFLG